MLCCGLEKCTSKSSSQKQHITISIPKATSNNVQQARSNTIEARFVSLGDLPNEPQNPTKVPGNTTSSYQPGKSSSANVVKRKSRLKMRKVHVTKSKQNLSSKMTIPRQDGSYWIECKHEFDEPSSHDSPKTSSTGNNNRLEDEKSSLDVINVQEDLRTNVLRALSNEEKVNFMKLEAAVAKLGFPYDSLTLAQFFIVSHGDVGESLDRMKSLQNMRKEYKIDKVNVADTLFMLEECTALHSIGGFDSEGRRVYLVNFGKVNMQRTTEKFPAFSKANLMLWDSLFLTIPEIRGGMSIIGDFTGYGAANWSLKIFIKFMKMWQYNYPVRVRRIYIINTPLFFWAIARFVMTFTAKKFQERFRFVSNEELLELIPRASLPPALGGTYEETKDVTDWIYGRLQQRHGIDWQKHYDC